MSLLDIAILAVLALGALRGLLRGLIKEAAALTALLLGGWLAFRYHEKAAVLLHGMLPPVAARMVAFVLLLILVGLAAHLLGNLLTGLVRLALLGWVKPPWRNGAGLPRRGIGAGNVFLRCCCRTLFLPVQGNRSKTPLCPSVGKLWRLTLDRAKTLRQQSP